MVIKDMYSMENANESSSSSPTKLAPPGDRLLAGFLDLLLHTPIFTLLSSVVLYRLNVLKLTISSTSEKTAIVIQLLWIILTGSVILQAIYLKLWKKTPGMRLLKLELRSFNGSDLTWGQCLLRSSVCALQFFLLGIPFLEIFAHSRRHAFHDRVSESEITTAKAWGSLSPLASEKAMVQLIFTTVLMLTLGWVTALFSGVQKNIFDGSMALAEWREQSRLCSQIDDVSGYSTVDLTDVKSRLDFAISLFLLEQIDSDCFRKEVDFANLKEMKGALPWVGRALISAKYSEEREKYSTKACSEDSRWCTKALLSSKSSSADAQTLLSDVSQKNFFESSLAYQTAALVLVNRLGASDSATKIIDSLQKRGIRATGLVAEQMRAFSLLNPEQVPNLLTTLKSVMVEKDFMQLNSDLCLRHLEAGCGGQKVECNVMVSLLPNYKESLEDLVVSRALFKSALCKQDLMENMEYWTLISSEGLQKLLRIAMQLEQESELSRGLAKLRQFIKDETQNLELRVDALQLLLSRSKFAEDWNLASYLWERLDWTQANYLAASEWLIREGGRAGKTELLKTLGQTFAQVPGLKMEWKLMHQGRHERYPANTIKAQE